MFNSSLLARRLLRSQLSSTRLFSSSALLVPLQEKESLPFEVRNTDLTDADLEKAQLEFKEFNVRCSEELKEMNQNRITNIIERGGVEGWETVSESLPNNPFLGSRSGPPYSQLQLLLGCSSSILRPNCRQVLRPQGSPPRVVCCRLRPHRLSQAYQPLRRQQSHSLRLPARRAHEPAIQADPALVHQVPPGFLGLMDLLQGLPGVLRPR